MLVLNAKHRLLVIGMFALGIGATAPTAWAATPITISASPYTITASGGYILAKNLTAVGSCITIAAPGGGNVVEAVAIDLQGHSITGNGTGDGIGCGQGPPVATSCNNIIIANGTVTQFSRGVFLTGNFNTVTSMTVTKSTGAGTNGDGIEVDASITEPLNIVKNSLSNGNAGIGIAVGGASDVVTTVIDSTANNNGADGIGAYTVRRTIMEAPASQAQGL